MRGGLSETHLNSSRRAVFRPPASSRTLLTMLRQVPSGSACLQQAIVGRTDAAVRIGDSPPDLLVLGAPGGIGDGPEGHHANPGRPRGLCVLEGRDNELGLGGLVSGIPAI